MAPTRKKIPKKIFWWVTGTAAVGVAALLIVAAVALRETRLRARFTAAMSDALSCDVSLDRLNVQILPVIRITGDGLAIRLRGRSDLPPYISVTRFTADLGLLSVLTRHVDTVHLDGMLVNVPPRLNPDGPGAAPEPPPGVPGTSNSTPGRRLFSVQHLVAHNAVLNFVGKENHSRPLVFPIDALDIQDAAIDREMRFTSSVMNPLPLGIVQTTGTFGPWNRADPTETQVAGTYAQIDGDLGTINGISGHVASAGEFKGSLAEIHVAGTSNTSNLSLDLGGRPAALTTEFIVTVDGTNGTTRLDRVDARLGNTPMLISGVVANLPGPGHDVRLAIDIAAGRMEDMLRLAITSDKPLVTGGVSVKATVRLPSGAGSARDRLLVSGTFGLRDAQFNDALMQSKLKELSRRGLGKNANEMPDRIATSMDGTFSLKSGTVSLPSLTFAVPGAVIDLEGRYSLGSEEVNFTGTAHLEASLSKVVGGFKSIFIAPFNRLFAKGGSGSVIPIEITGTRSQPAFHVRMSQVFKKGKG